MKFVFLATILSLSTSLFAQSVDVQDYAQGFFNCNNIREQAVRNIQRQCAQRNMKLTQYSFGQCVPAGTDGGYVTYFNLMIYGTCTSLEN